MGESTYTYKPEVIPPNVEMAAHRFAAACSREGYAFASPTISGGALSSISLEKDGISRTFYLIEGSWFELVEVEQ